MRCLVAFERFSSRCFVYSLTFSGGELGATGLTMLVVSRWSQFESHSTEGVHELRNAKMRKINDEKKSEKSMKISTHFVQLLCTVVLESLLCKYQASAPPTDPTPIVVNLVKKDIIFIQFYAFLKITNFEFYFLSRFKLESVLFTSSLSLSRALSGFTQIKKYFYTMMNWNFVRKLSTVSVGSALVWYFNKDEVKTVFGATKWDYNWDQRDKRSDVSPNITSKIVKRSADLETKEVQDKKPTARRHMILIRHGQYNMTGINDGERYLTETGRVQAKITGERLKLLQLPFDDVVISTMTRAQETGNIILDVLPRSKELTIAHEPLIEEGAPIPPEPKMGGFRPEFYVRRRFRFI